MLFIGSREIYRNVKRYRQIGEVLVKHGFGYIIGELGLMGLIPLRKKQKPGLEKIPKATRLKMVLEELGPTYIKLGQLLSTRVDLFPEDIIIELEKLQDEVVSFSASQVKNRIETELSMDMDEIFEDFDIQPLAAASIGQVHEGTLKTGEKVVIKVRRPDIENTVEADLSLLTNIAKLVEQRMPNTETYKPTQIVEEFARTIRRELDYRIEGRNADRFRYNMKDDINIRIPNIYWDYSTSKVLTMEKMVGIKAGNIEGLSKTGINRKNVAKRIAKVCLKQILEDGFFHADPHPGNILIKSDCLLGFLDFGIVGRIDNDLMMRLIRLFSALIHKKTDKIAQILLDIGMVTSDPDIDLLKYEIQYLIDEYYDRPIGEIEVGKFLHALLNLSYTHKIKMPRNFILLGKTVLTLEGICRKLDPEFNVIEVIEPYVKSLFTSGTYYERLGAVYKDEVTDLAKAIVKAPIRAETVLKKIERDEFKVEFKFDGLKQLLAKLDFAANRLALSLITAALIVGSSLIMQADKGPELWGFPVIGLFGFSVAGLFGLWVIIQLLRSGNF